MGQPDRLVEWLRQQLDDDERVAKTAVISAHQGPNAYQPHPELATWRYVPGGEVEYVSTPEMERHEYHEPYRVTCDSEGILPAVDESVGAHIARHDPARALAQVAAHREILDLYQSAASHADLPEGVHDGRDSDERERDEDVAEVLKEVVGHLATVYADREGWREEWTPE